MTPGGGGGTVYNGADGGYSWGEAPNAKNDGYGGVGPRFRRSKRSNSTLGVILPRFDVFFRTLLCRPSDLKRE